jgi:hypothetical protein
LEAVIRFIYRVSHIKCSPEIYDEPSHSLSRWVQGQWMITIAR